MRTIPRNYPSLPGPPGERKAMCDMCSMFWYRSAMRRMPGGQLWCPDETGRDAVTCDRVNAQNGARATRRRPTPDRW
jgi:hypothetical protein